jgi:hypothetical protein
MAIVIQDFIQWQPNKSKVIGNYIKPSSKSIFNVVSLTLIQLDDINLFNNLINGDRVTFTATDRLPSGLVGTYYIRKNISQRVSLHSTQLNAINDILPFNFSDNGVGTNTINVNFNFILKCNNKGDTGLFEPIWNRQVNSLINDSTCEWKLINPLVTDIDPLDLLPEARQKEDAFIKISDLLAHQLAVINNEIKPLTDKYKDYFNFDEKFIYALLKEFGYEYLADASILDTSNLSVLLSYLKLIHFLKGTRQGLQLVLKLLGYDYTEILWYEKIIKGEPHTFDLNLTVPISAVNVTTIGNLNKFLRYYVYPIARVVTDILPFEFMRTIAGGGGFGDQVHEFNMSFEIPIIGNLDLFNFPYQDGQGLKVTDLSDNLNDAFIVQTEIDPTASFRFIYKNQVIPIQDLSINNNDANIITSIIDKKDLFEFAYTDGTGLTISDGSVNNNDSSIISSVVPDFILFDYLYTDGTGLIVSDSSTLNNDSSIISSDVNPTAFNYQYTNGTGLTVTNNNGNVPSSTIISTTDIPQLENLLAWYRLNTNSLDLSGNGNNATVTGGTFSGNRLVLDTNDYLNIPNAVLNGKTDFSYGGWFNLTAVNSICNSLLSLSTSSQFNALTLKYKPSIKGFDGLYNNQGYSFSVPFSTVNYDGQSDFETLEHHVVLTRQANKVSLYIDGELRSNGNFYTGVLSVDVNSLLIGQDQGSGLDVNQSLNGSIDNIFFYDIELKQSEVIKWYQKARV